jgi:hypothetical protein
MPEGSGPKTSRTSGGDSPAPSPSFGSWARSQSRRPLPSSGPCAGGPAEGRGRGLPIGGVSLAFCPRVGDEGRNVRMTGAVCLSSRNDDKPFLSFNAVFHVPDVRDISHMPGFPKLGFVKWSCRRHPDLSIQR